MVIVTTLSVQPHVTNMIQFGNTMSILLQVQAQKHRLNLTLVAWSTKLMLRKLHGDEQ